MGFFFPPQGCGKNMPSDQLHHKCFSWGVHSHCVSRPHFYPEFLKGAVQPKMIIFIYYHYTILDPILYTKKFSKTNVLFFPLHIEEVNHSDLGRAFIFR